MGILRGYVFQPAITLQCVDLCLLVLKANILINCDGRACIADFGLLMIIPDHASFVSMISCSEGGTIRWMSPELLNPESFGLKDSRPTKESDCYALGMVVYEVLSRRMPFSGDRQATVMLRIVNGERPRRPQGRRGVWFTDALWEMLELCWKPQPCDRPSLKALIQCLEGATPPTPTTNKDAVTGTDDSTVTNHGTFQFHLGPSSRVSG